MLAALWFVPSANASQGASQESSTVTGTSAVTRTSTTSTDDAATTTDATARTAHAAQVPASDRTGGDGANGSSGANGPAGSGGPGGANGDTGTGDATRPLSDPAGSADLDGPAGTRLADTGSIDTTPYVIGGTLLLGLGAGFVAFSVRRERATAY
jgi:LPXTG-motif cell wall-anchored protein